MGNTTGKKFGGREKGTPNKATKKARDLFQTVMDGEQKRIRTALNEIYKEDKKQYLYVLNKYFPYYMPKKEQVDISIGNTDLPFTINVERRKNTGSK